MTPDVTKLPQLLATVVESCFRRHVHLPAPTRFRHLPLLESCHHQQLPMMKKCLNVPTLLRFYHYLQLHVWSHKPLLLWESSPVILTTTISNNEICHGRKRKFYRHIVPCGGRLHEFAPLVFCVVTPSGAMLSQYPAISSMHSWLLTSPLMCLRPPNPNPSLGGRCKSIMQREINSYT